MANIRSAFDISAVGTIITFTQVNGGGSHIITEFSDEGTPFDSPDVDASTNKKNLNGTMISSRTPSVYPFSVTVIPGSADDDFLWSCFHAALIQPGSAITPADRLLWNCTLKVPNINESGRNTGTRTFTFTNCRIKSGPTGPSASAEGRLSSRTYTWEAEGLTRS